MIRRGAVLPAERHASPPKRWIRLVFGAWLAALALLAASAALAQRTSLAGGPHDFRRGHADRPADGSDLCVYCHTPFGERASPNGPQWYRSVQPGLGFQAYATQDDPLAVGMGFDVAGMSVVCLSCHDASQAPTVTALINDHPYGGTFLRVAPGADRVEAANNLLVGPGTYQVKDRLRVFNDVNADWKAFVRPSREDYRLSHPEAWMAYQPNPETELGLKLIPHAQYVHPRSVRPLSSGPTYVGAIQEVGP